MTGWIYLRLFSEGKTFIIFRLFNLFLIFHFSFLFFTCHFFFLSPFLCLGIGAIDLLRRTKKFLDHYEREIQWKSDEKTSERR